MARSGAASVRAYGIQSGVPVFGSRIFYSLGSSRPISISVAAGGSKIGRFGGLLGNYNTGSGNGFGGSRGTGGGIGRTGGFGLAGVFNRPIIFGSGAIQEVTTSKSLLQPLNEKTDPQTVEMKVKGSELIKTLNDKLASFFDKACFVEQQNKTLETIWGLLQQQDPSSITSTNSLDTHFESFISSLQVELDDITLERGHLDSELRNVQDTVADYTKKYEDEINKQITAENDSVMLKKEMSQLQNHVNDTSVAFPMGKNRSLDLHSIISGTRTQFEDIAQRNKVEAELLYQTKNEKLNSVVVETEQNGETVIRYANIKLQDSQAALKKDKDDLDGLLRDYQQLLETTMTLDTEITAYRQLLEGAEYRVLTDCCLVFPTAVVNNKTSSSALALSNGYRSGFGVGRGTGSDVRLASSNGSRFGSGFGASGFSGGSSFGRGSGGSRGVCGGGVISGSNGGGSVNLLQSSRDDSK
ncbi:Keratin, type II cytoskeletal 3 [Cricetulus griseus]|uniref:Keratin, type II cytoskeletal 3 n=1 Tax=Cricetulus griseus TaxID=10029 RepID=G3IKD3_CRIGR|nr:Keratin, type II cytoskeletal 3 [Cricetulus griseus]